MPFVRPGPTALVGAAATVCLASGILLTSWPWVVDDTFISLRYAERLANGHGLTWTTGERVEGYSNLLWVLANAALIALGVDGTAAARALGIVCTALTLLVLLQSRLLPPNTPARLAVPVVASLATTATWASAGLEGPLVMLLLAVALAPLAPKSTAAGDAGSRGQPAVAGLALALLVWTRPDAPLWIAVVAASATLRVRSLRTGSARTTLYWLVGLPLIAFSAQLLFRHGYYGDWLPITAYAKLGSSADARRAGFDYVRSNAGAMRALLLPALLAIPAAFVPATRFLVGTAFAATIAWWSYVLLVGGDTFPRGRLLVPSLVPLTLLAAHGIGWLSRLGRFGNRLAWTAGLSCVALALVDAHRATDDPRQRLSSWEWAGKATGEWLGRVFRTAQPLLAVDAAGAVPYFSRLPCLDMLGLCDRTIARTPYPASAPFTAGHSRANGGYVITRAPDLVLFDTPPGSPRPKWLGAHQLEADPRFLADWRLVSFDPGTVVLPTGESPALRIIAWVRLPGRLGATPDPTAPHRLRLPAFWLGSHRQPYCFTPGAQPSEVPMEQLVRDVHTGADWLLDPGILGVADAAGDDVVAEVRRSGHFVLRELPLAAGRYRLSAPGLPGSVSLALRHVDGSALADANGDYVVQAAGGQGLVDLVCDVPADTAVPFRLRHLHLERRE